MDIKWCLAIYCLSVVQIARSEKITKSDSTLSQDSATALVQELSQHNSEATSTKKLRSPDLILTRENIELSGAKNLGDFFRNDAVLSPRGSFQGDVSFRTFDMSAADLLGLGRSRTLVLLNGIRLASLPGLKTVNLNNIPLVMVEQIEVLWGGASAVHGSDAIGGVVNVVLKKNVPGTELSTFTNFKNGGSGDTREIDAFQGIDLGNQAQLSLAVGLSSTKTLHKKYRDLSFGYPDRQYTATNPPPGTWSYQPVVFGEQITFGAWAPSENCPEANRLATVPDESHNIYCAGRREEIREELAPQKEEYYAMAILDWNLSPKTTSSFLLSYRLSESLANQGRFFKISTDPIFNSPLLVSRERALALNIVPESEAGDYFFIYTRMNEEPERTYINKNTAITAIGTLSNKLVENWQTDFSLSYSFSSAQMNGRNIANSEVLSSLMINADGRFGEDPIYNPLDAARDVSQFVDSFDELQSYGVSELVSFDFLARSNLLKLKGGVMSVGIGASLFDESFEEIPDEFDQLFNFQNQPLYVGDFVSEGKGHRTTAATYANFYAPFTEHISAAGAVRYDRTSDAVGMPSYNLSVNLQLSENYSLDVKTSRSFRMPPMNFVHQKGLAEYTNILDTNWCQREQNENRSCNSQRPTRPIRIETPGNSELYPERGFNYGMSFTMKPYSKFVLFADYYGVVLKDVFASDGNPQEIVDLWYSEHGIASDGGSVGGNWVTVDTDGIIDSIGIPIRNLGELRMNAMIVRSDLTFNLAFLKVAIQSWYFRFFSYKLRDIPTEPMVQKVGYYGFPLWRFQNQLKLATGPHQWILTQRITSAQSQDPNSASLLNRGSRVSDHYEYDLVYRTELPWDSTLLLGVNNLFDSLGGLTTKNSSIGAENSIAPQLYSLDGRTFFLKLTQDF